MTCWFVYKSLSWMIKQIPVMILKVESGLTWKRSLEYIVSKSLGNRVFIRPAIRKISSCPWYDSSDSCDSSIPNFQFPKLTRSSSQSVPSKKKVLIQLILLFVNNIIVLYKHRSWWFRRIWSRNGVSIFISWKVGLDG